MERLPSRARTLLSVVAVAALLSACAASQPLGTAQSPTTPAAASIPAATITAPPTTEPTPSPSVEESGTPVPSIEGVTPEPDSPSPTTAPASNAVPVVSHRFFKVWTDVIGYVHYEAIVEVTNLADHPVGISGGQDYTIYAKDGSVLETGTFTYAFPNVVAPGAKGYLVEGSEFDQGVKAKTVGKFEDDLNYTDETTADVLMTASAVRVSQESYGTGLQVSCVVTNRTGADASDVLAGFIFFDGSGNIVGALYDNTVDRVADGKSKGVKTSYPGTPPLKPALVKKTLVIAFDQSY